MLVRRQHRMPRACVYVHSGGLRGPKWDKDAGRGKRALRIDLRGEDGGSQEIEFRSQNRAMAKERDSHSIGQAGIASSISAMRRRVSRRATTTLP